MKKRLISQIDQRWFLDARYDMRSVDALGVLDNKIVRLLDNPTTKNKQSAAKALTVFFKAVEKLIKCGYLTKAYSNYSIFGYGCWDCCMCMVLSDFEQSLLECGAHSPLRPTPPNFLRVLRSWQLLSVLGYQTDIVIDLMAVITRSRIQLVLHEDYGTRGITADESPLLQFARRYHKDITLVACVKDHHTLGKKPATHWIVLDPAGPELSDGIMMRDPAKAEIKRFSYRKLYTLCLYSTPKLARTILIARSLL